MKKYLFLCSSKYTIFNAINAVLNNVEGCRDNSDIVLFHITDDIRNISEKIKERKIFCNVYDFPFINNMRAVYLLLLFVFPKIFLKKISLNNEVNYLFGKQYDVLISQNQLYASLLRRVNKNADVYFIEDGLSSYTGLTVLHQQRSLYFRLANKFLFQGELISDVKAQMLYHPEMYLGERCNLKKLPICQLGDIAVYNEIFGYKNSSLYLTHKFVYLGTPCKGIRKLTSNPNDSDEQLLIDCQYAVDSLLKMPKKTHVLYRAHPVENIDENHYQGVCVFDTYQNMWELECQNTIDDNHVLISFFSTASFTPKLLYGKEPYVIFLYKILGVDIHNVDELISCLQSMYADSQKVLIPKNIDELYEIIAKLEFL